jgi:hypothetical protein
MRYWAAYKPDCEPLDHFIKRKAGINACAARFVNGGQDRYRMRRRVSRLPGLTDRV